MTVTPCQKLLKQESTARRIESMQQSSTTPKNQDVGRGLRKIVACSQSSSQCFLVSTVFGRCYPYILLRMIFILVSLIFSAPRQASLHAMARAACMAGRPRARVLGRDVQMRMRHTHKMATKASESSSIRYRVDWCTNHRLQFVGRRVEEDGENRGLTDFCV